MTTATPTVEELEALIAETGNVIKGQELDIAEKRRRMLGLQSENDQKQLAEDQGLAEEVNGLEQKGLRIFAAVDEIEQGL